MLSYHQNNHARHVVWQKQLGTAIYQNTYEQCGRTGTSRSTSFMYIQTFKYREPTTSPRPCGAAAYLMQDTPGEGKSALIL